MQRRSTPFPSSSSHARRVARDVTCVGTAANAQQRVANSVNRPRRTPPTIAPAGRRQLAAARWRRSHRRRRFPACGRPTSAAANADTALRGARSWRQRRRELTLASWRPEDPADCGPPRNIRQQQRASPSGRKPPRWLPQLPGASQRATAGVQPPPARSMTCWRRARKAGSGSRTRGQAPMASPTPASSAS